ncbi:hypothetical protein DFH28DRAFT_1198469 [Melampsora americana]|nr:hypothetical protein DFH28DRAFT_1198469 [Melampsora americana]
MGSNALAKHSRSANHKKNHKIWLAKQKEAATRVKSPNNDYAMEVEPDPASQDGQIPAYIPDIADVEPDRQDLDDCRKRLLDSWTKDLSNLFRSPALSVSSSTGNSINEAVNSNHTERSTSEKEESVNSDQTPHDDTMDEEDSPWAPFSNLEALIVGLSSNWLGRSFLGQQGLRGLFWIMSVYAASLAYSEQQFRRIARKGDSETGKNQLNFTTKQELANPYVVDFLEFIPELPDATSKVHRLSQSKKWREELDEDIRVQMVEQGNTHFYLYELVQLQSKKIVIPFYFYKSGDQVLAKCVYAVQHFVKEGRASKIRTEFKSVSGFDSPSFSTINVNTFWRNFDQIKLPDGQLMKGYCSEVMYAQQGADFIEVPFINPWRIKAHGRIIRHVPLVLYCDDLSGNVSKRWNKHMAFYFTLAGALELADPLIDELNKLTTDGFVAYDHKAKSEVFVMTTILCHLGDSPMHAEDLSPEGKIFSRKAVIQNCLPTRDWTATAKGTKDLWKKAQLPGPVSHFETESASLGLRDSLNTNFVKRAQDLHKNVNVSKEYIADMCRFNGHRDTPVEILHVVLLGIAKYLLRHQMNGCSSAEKDKLWGRWRSFDTSGLNIPPIQPKSMIQHFQSLNGKEFRVVLQAAPFVFLETKMSNEERQAWTALAHLAPYLFQTEITNVDLYLKELENLIQAFLKKIVQLSAQWCNKPKFHMLIHLCDSIRRFGPPCLFATENFESYNGNTRSASVHSNHLSPGRDIANSFNSYKLIRALTSGAALYDRKLRTYIRSGLKVQELFQNNKPFQKALGFNASWNSENTIKIGRKGRRQPSHTRDLIPNDIFNSFSAKDWKVLESIILKNQQKVIENCFISFKNTNSSIGRIARVKRIWGVGGCAIEQTIIEANHCQMGQVSAFYGLREIKQTETSVWIKLEDIEGVLNVQHNCYHSKCNVQKVRPTMIERQVSKRLEFEVVHETTMEFILNSGAFYSAELHRTSARMTLEESNSHDWVMAVEKGLANWEEAVKKKNETKEKKRQKENDKLLGSQTGHLPAKKKSKTKSNGPAPSNSELVDRYLSHGQPIAGSSREQRK